MENVGLGLQGRRQGRWSIVAGRMQLRVASSDLKTQVMVDAKAVDAHGTSGLKSGNYGVNQICGG